MNSNPYAVPAIVACALILIACITGLCWASYAQRPAAGRHARPHQARHEFTGPAGRDDPGGEQFTAQLRDEPDWRGQEPPVSRVEVLTGPGTRIERTSELTMNVLGRVLAGLRSLDTAPPAPGEARSQPALLAWDGKTARQVADELAAEHLTQRMLP